MTNIQAIGLLVIRIGLAGVLLWFGFQQLSDASSWTGYVPEHVLSLSGLSASLIVSANGAIEMACGLFLLLGIFTRAVSLVMGVHMALIAISLGMNAVAVRDWGLAFAFLGLVLTGGGFFGFDKEAA